MTVVLGQDYELMGKVNIFSGGFATRLKIYSTKTDVLSIVLLVARFPKATIPHRNRAVKCVMSFVKGTLSIGLLFEIGTLDITTFVDSDNANDIADCNSMTGFIIRLGDDPCVWGSQKQHTIALSTCK